MFTACGLLNNILLLITPSLVNSPCQVQCMTTVGYSELKNAS